MIYIVSDIHGCYDRWKKLLEKINFSSKDKLYVLGDVIDRGPGSFDILFDIMGRKNVEMFIGNHEHMMLTYLNGTDRMSWFYKNNGGEVTYNEYKEFDQKTKNDIIDYLRNKTTVVKKLNINGHHYVLSHTGVYTDNQNHYTKDYLDIMDIQDFVWNQYGYNISQVLDNRRKIKNRITYISGHRITRRFHGKDEIFILDFDNGYRWIDIDCGCAIGNGEGNLACLVIDEQTGEITDTVYIN